MRRIWLLVAFILFGLFGASPAAAIERNKPADADPVRIVIEQIGMDRTIASVGLDKQKVPIVPKHDVGWYNLSARPGQGENVVLWGHVLRFRETPKISAPFARLKELKKGAVIVLYSRDGTKHRYVITKQVQVKPSEVKYILPQGKEQLTLVSCAGNKVIVDGDVKDMSHRLITIAEPE